MLVNDFSSIREGKRGSLFPVSEKSKYRLTGSSIVLANAINKFTIQVSNFLLPLSRGNDVQVLGGEPRVALDPGNRGKLICS